MKLFSVLALQGAQACLNLNKCDNGSSGESLGSSGSSDSDDSETSGFRSDCITALTSYDHSHPEEGIFKFQIFILYFYTVFFSSL